MTRGHWTTSSKHWLPIHHLRRLMLRIHLPWLLIHITNVHWHLRRSLLRMLPHRVHHHVIRIKIMTRYPLVFVQQNGVGEIRMTNRTNVHQLIDRHELIGCRCLRLVRHRLLWILQHLFQQLGGCIVIAIVAAELIQTVQRGALEVHAIRIVHEIRIRRAFGCVGSVECHFGERNHSIERRLEF